MERLGPSHLSFISNTGVLLHLHFQNIQGKYYGSFMGKRSQAISSFTDPWQNIHLIKENTMILWDIDNRLIVASFYDIFSF